MDYLNKNESGLSVVAELSKMLFLIFAVIVVCILLLIILHKNFIRQQSKYLQNVPGPKPNPFFGNMLDFAVPTYDIFNVLAKYVSQHGPIIKIFYGPLKYMVMTSDEELIEYVFSSPQILEKAGQYDHLHNWLGRGLLTSTGIKWKKHRRMITPAFHFSILENFLDVFDRNGETLLKQLEQHIGEKSFNVSGIISLYALDVICEAAMGISINAQMDGESKYVRCVKTMCSIITSRNFSPLHTCLYPLTPNSFREKMALKVLHNHTDAVIDQRIEKMKDKEQSTDEVEGIGIKKKEAFLDLLLKSTIDGEKLSRKDIREEVDTFMFEGHDTTSSAICFALYSLANNPQVQKRAFEEQIDIFGGNKNIKLEISHLQQMKYLDLIIKETLRLYPSVPLLGRTVPKDFEWGNSIFPKGLEIVVQIYLCHRNPMYFPNPLEFNPERFLNMDGKHPYRYVPFSAGPRNCIGQKFAMMEMKSTISKVLRNFELLPAVPNHELQLAPEVILVSKNGINLALKKREYI